MKIKDLELVLSLLILKIKEDNSSEVEIDADLYWDIQLDDIYNPYVIPKDMTLGQLSDDWQELLRLLDQDLAPINHDLKRIASILRALSHNR